MVMANPIQFTIVSAVPCISAVTFLATRVENRGESIITTIPQKSRKPRKTLSDSVVNIQGESRQQPQDKSSAVNAICLVPMICERYPPNTQANPPIPIIRKDHNGILNIVSACVMLYVLSIIGTKAQNAYNSHICPK